MSNSPHRLASLVTVLLFIGATAWAGTAVIDGNVLDQKGLPLKGADIRIERSGGSAWNQTVKTNDKGYYSCSGLQPGATFRVTLVVNNAVKASVNNVKTRISPAAHMNFDMSKDKLAGAPRVASNSAKKKTHMVWVPPETGSNLGGHWAEVGDNGPGGETERVQKAGNDALRSLQHGAR